MKKIYVFIFCLLLVLPSACLAEISGNLNPTIGVVRIGDDFLLNDAEIISIIDDGTASLFDTEKYNYRPFSDLEPEFSAFLTNNNVQDSSNLTDELLLKFANEQNLDYLLFLNFNPDEFQQDRVFFKSAYHIMLSADIKFLDTDATDIDSSTLYINHLFADGNAKNEAVAYRKGAKKVMRRIAAHFNVDSVLD